MAPQSLSLYFDENEYSFKEITEVLCIYTYLILLLCGPIRNSFFRSSALILDRILILHTKLFGKGEPILLISGASTGMNAWNATTLRSLSSNHTVIVFDSRGVGNTTTGSKLFSIQQLANDTAGLLDAQNTESKCSLIFFRLIHSPRACNYISR